MKSFFQKMRKEEGFTLVELMVVVAIIGLLSAVAVPNFKKYQAKSKISEAKLQLSAAYTAQQAFFSDYNIYANCLRYMGYDPDRESANRYYAIGFPAAVTARAAGAHTAALNSGLLDSACPATGAIVDGTGNTTASATYFLAGKGVGATIANSVGAMTGNAAGAAGVCTNSASVSGGACVGSQADTANMSFNVAAVGYISGDNLTPATASGITMDNNKIIRTLVNGY